MAKKKDKKLTIDSAMADFRAAHSSRRALLEREREDFRYALGSQWSSEDEAALSKAGMKAVTDNRIAPNIFLLTGLERQNRADLRAFPEGEEDGLLAEIATALFRDSAKRSGFQHKSSEQFKDGITCGESHLELYLDYADSPLNGSPRWRKCDGSSIFPDPASREYDFSDARYVFKVTLGVDEGDLINLYPEKQSSIERAEGGDLNLQSLLEADGKHRQPKDYPAKSRGVDAYADAPKPRCFDLVERFYKKWVETHFVGDKKTGAIEPAESRERAETFVRDYQSRISADQDAYVDAVRSALDVARSADPRMELATDDDLLRNLEAAGAAPPPPPPQDPDRFVVIKRQVPEIWVFAFAAGVEEPLADERAWCYPKWKSYPFVPYFARFSTAPLEGEDRQLLIQGLVHGVKGVQEKHNKAETLMLRHLNSATNSGWLAEEDSWVDPEKVEQFGAVPGINLEYKKGRQKPERIFPMPLSQGHAQVSAESAEAIKAQLGINADLLAANEGGGDSGRAIALRQKQGLLMVQELFDNLSRSKQIAGRMLLSQMGEMYDTETAMKVLGESFLRKHFPPMVVMDPLSGQPQPMMGADGQPMSWDKPMAEVAVAEVLQGGLGEYNVEVGEAVASETQRMAASAEVRDIAQQYPGIVGPDILVKYSQLSETAKSEILSAIRQAQAAQAEALRAQQRAPQRPAQRGAAEGREE